MTAAIVCRTDRLRAHADTARWAWMEMDTAHTSYAMRKAAETRYLTLRALLLRYEGATAAPPAALHKPERWRAAAERAVA